MRFLANPVRSLFVGAALVGAALTFTSCGGSDAPTAPTQSPTPAPGNTPPPTSIQPTPTPTPPPAGGGGAGLSASCRRLTASSGTERDCRLEGTGVYAGAVSAAIDSVSAENRDGNAVVYFGGYFDEIIKALDADGICAVPEGDNLFVRAVGDEFNEYYDVVTSRGDISKRYTNTCRPAVATPQIQTPGQLDPTCRLPASRETVCEQNSAPLFDAEVREAIEAVAADDRARATPIIFDFNDRLPGSSDGWRVLDIQRYHDAVMAKLREKGFCAYFDTEDIQVKNSNRVSAHWDIIKAEGYRIQLWAGTCRDAAF
jgi:hypothetical protein